MSFLPVEKGKEKTVMFIKFPEINVILKKTKLASLTRTDVDSPKMSRRKAMITYSSIGIIMQLKNKPVVILF